MTPSPPTSTLFPYAALFRSAQAVTLSNPSGAALTITSIGFTGTNPGDFGQTNNCPLSPSTLAANGTYTISAHVSTTVTATSRTPSSASEKNSNSPQTAGVSGTGVSLPRLA